MAVIVTEGVPIKPRKIGGRTTINQKGEILSQVGAEEDTRVHRRTEQSRPYKTVKITGEDGKRTRDILKEHFPKTWDSAKENIAKQDKEQKDGDWVRYNSEMKLRLSQADAERAITHMRRVLPKGPPSTRPTFTMGAHIENGVVVHDD